MKFYQSMAMDTSLNCCKFCFAGENLFPKEIEYFLESHPSISQILVIILTYYDLRVLRIYILRRFPNFYERDPNILN